VDPYCLLLIAIVAEDRLAVTVKCRPLQEAGTIHAVVNQPDRVTPGLPDQQAELLLLSCSARVEFAEKKVLIPTDSQAQDWGRD